MQFPWTVIGFRLELGNLQHICIQASLLFSDEPRGQPVVFSSIWYSVGSKELTEISILDSPLVLSVFILYHPADEYTVGDW